MKAAETLKELFATGVAACDPYARTALAVAELRLDGHPGVIAIGKGAARMFRGAADALAPRTPAVGLVVAHHEAPRDLEARYIRGDHPVPGSGSFAAADALESAARACARTADTLVLLSGGASSLIADARHGLSRDDLLAAFRALHRAGAPIDAMNQLRRRLLRWADGRLAAALAPSRVHCLIVSDVMHGGEAAVGSGPCLQLPATKAELMAALTAWGGSLPAAAHDMIARDADVEPTARPSTVRTILSNATATTAIRDAARRQGLDVVQVTPETIDGEARDTGSWLGSTLAALSLGGARDAVVVLGGETTVRLPAGSTGAGGRCQELALACALELKRAGAHRVTVLAAGTDGRDGPGDAAGAIVNAETPARIRDAGVDPAGSLEGHDSGTALDRAGALLRTGPTGTNVNDVVVALLH